MEQTGSLKDFQVLKKLGEGAFGQVYMVRRKLDDQLYALKKVKLISMKDKEKQNAINEIRILASLNDEFVIKFKEAFFESSSNCLCIVMEYASGGDLLKMINQHTKTRQRIDEKSIWKAIFQITQGLKSLHDKKILHRDLKSANVFITEDKFKLGDLNVSKVLKKDLAHTQTGTPYYASPQVWQDLPYDMKSDMWSLGCVIYEMAALQPPFKASDLEGLFKKVKAGKYRPIPVSYSSDLAEIIAVLLKTNPKNRLDADALLKHPIVIKRCGAELKNQAENINPNSTDPLLKTIKYNPYNLNSLKTKLPKSSYNEEEKTISRSKESKDSLDSLSFVHKDRERMLSACGVRNSGISPAGYKKDQNKYVLKQQPRMLLPPKPRKLTEDYGYREPNYRLRRIGEDIIGRPSQRCPSVNQ